ncbi:hypothetical protein PF008_g24225 [Phytophthora fragariae]|uniref:Secreted protein n=1 Tax=Phytophthora fragariae TaxID=53985 RepID=A0A6G0QNH5_9STRA|nr:hypothetical protein PF008_g24225 [Phytophthora fragariae]
MSLLLATLYYCLLSLPFCALPYLCRACTTALQPDLRGVIKILPRRVLLGGASGWHVSPKRACGSTPRMITRRTGFWHYVPRFITHVAFPVELLRPSNRVVLPPPRRSPSLKSVDLHLGAFFFRRPVCPLPPRGTTPQLFHPLVDGTGFVNGDCPAQVSLWRVEPVGWNSAKTRHLLSRLGRTVGDPKETPRRPTQPTRSAIVVGCLLGPTFDDLCVLQYHNWCRDPGTGVCLFLLGTS